MAVVSAWEVCGYDMFLKEGEIKMGPPLQWTGPDPAPRGCDVFITDLPKEFHIDTLLTVCNNISPVFIARLKVNDLNYKCRGCGFVTFGTKEIAAMAVSKLNGAILSSGVKITAKMSMDNRRLHLKGVPAWLGIVDIWERLKRYVNTIKDILKVKQDVVVYFEDYEAASKAKKTLGQNMGRIWSPEVVLEWGDPEF